MEPLPGRSDSVLFDRAAPLQRLVLTLVVIAAIGGCSTPSASQTGAASPPPSASAAVGGTPPATVGVSPSPSIAAVAGRIVFARYVAGGRIYEIFSVDPSGSSLREVLPNTYSLVTPRWSWQGDLVLAMATSVPTILPTNAANHIHLRPPGSITLRCLAWSPDARTVACEGWDQAVKGKEGIYTIPTMTTALDPFNGEQIPVAAPIRLTTPPKGIRDVPGDYSADGRIVFVRMTYAVLGLGEIWIVNADGSNPRKITDTLTTPRICWSRDGRWIVGERDGILEVFDLENLTADPVKIQIPGGKATEPRFSPDSTRIVFVFTKTGAKTTSIESVTLAGTDLVQITSGQLDRSPDWGAPGF
jgi:Tol biopolymer transport system component